MANILEERLKIIKQFPSTFEETSKDERFLALALCGEVGELANLIKKRWRDGVDLSEEIKDEIADIRIYLELLAQIYGIEGDKLNEHAISKMNRKLKTLKNG